MSLELQFPDANNCTLPVCRNHAGWSALAYSASQLDPSLAISAFLVNSGARVLVRHLPTTAQATPDEDRRGAAPVAPLAALVRGLLQHPSIQPAERHLALFGAAMSQQLWPSPPLLPTTASTSPELLTPRPHQLMQHHVEAVLVAEGRCPGSQIPGLLLAVKASLQPYWQAAAHTTANANRRAAMPHPLSRLCLNRIRSAVGVKRLAAASAVDSTCGPRNGGRLHEQLRLPARMEDYLTLTRLPETMMMTTTMKAMKMISSMPKKRMMMMMMTQKTDDEDATSELTTGSCPLKDQLLHTNGDSQLEDPLALRIRALLENSSKSV